MEGLHAVFAIGVLIVANTYTGLENEEISILIIFGLGFHMEEQRFQLVMIAI
jgi:hypothetical protein